MTKHKQESADDWMQYARDYAKAEKELGIEHWVYIGIGYYDDHAQRVTLHTYDLPRELYERRRWVVRWRVARLQCLYPRYSVDTHYSYYDKRTGLRTDFNSCLRKLASAKAQITKARRSEARYIDEQRRRYPLFYDENNDPELTKFREKITRKEENCRLLAESIRQAVENNNRHIV